ncbi:hypothetical protein BGZ72_003663 [Mortierella alpina]|nr:hypothetical protein BGZ72_003663 [Mortierella alpina]
MRIRGLILAASCLAITFTNAVTIPEISQLVGPLADTPVPAAGSGSVTDPSSTSFRTGTTSRLALYVPGNVYKDYPGWLAFYKALVFQGIPVTVTKNINTARTYATVIAYQSLQAKYMVAGDGTDWATYVSSGRTLIAIGFNSTNSNLKSAFGITPDVVTNARNRATIVLQAPLAAYPATSVNSQFNQSVANDVQIPLWSKSTNTGFPTIGYTLSSSNTAPPYGVVALGKYLINGGATDTKAAITIKSRSNGGKAVAIGFDVGAYVGASIGGKTDGIPRTYVAKYDPGFDNIFRMIKKLYETSTPTGLVTSWPVPGNKGVHFSWTYDIDAQDSYELAYQCAKDLQQRGMGGTINWQAKIVRDAYDVASLNISMVEALGNMELASHSVSHSPNLVQYPIGTGKEVFNGTDYKGNNYYPFIGQCLDPTNTGAWATIVPNATICETPNDSLFFYSVGGSLLGEARVSKFILEAISITQSKVTSFRTGHLLYPDALPQVLQAAGFKYSSSGSSNDRNTHMPYQAFYSQAYNQAVDLLEFPLSASDEDGQINGDWYGPGGGTNLEGSYAYQQLEVVKKLAVYGAQYTFLIHPTTHAVPGVVGSLFSDKLAFQQVFASKIGDLAYVDTMVGRGDFHNARIAAGIDVAVSGTTATVTVTLPKPIIDLTLRVPTAWAFATSTTAVKVSPGAVVLVNSVPAGTVKLTFKTSGTVTTTSAPPPGPTPTTTTIAMATPTLPAPTPASVNPRIVDDFSDPQRYGNEKNAIDVYTSDENTGSAKASVQADWLLLNVVKDTTYWYTLLGPLGSCNDYHEFTRLNLAIRFPTATRFGFEVVLQEAAQEVLGCSSTEQKSYRFNVTSMINSAVAGPDEWIPLDIDLGVFSEADPFRLRAVLLDSFSASGQLEIDYVRFS